MVAILCVCSSFFFLFFTTCTTRISDTNEKNGEVTNMTESFLVWCGNSATPIIRNERMDWTKIYALFSALCSYGGLIPGWRNGLCTELNGWTELDSLLAFAWLALLHETLYRSPSCWEELNGGWWMKWIEIDIMRGGYNRGWVCGTRRQLSTPVPSGNSNTCKPSSIPIYVHQLLKFPQQTTWIADQCMASLPVLLLALGREAL